MPLTTHPADEADAAFAREAHHGAYRDVVTRQFGAWDEQVQDGFFDRSWDDHDHEIILRDDVPCGYTSVECGDDHIHVREFVIHPAFQGQGIGTAFWIRQARRYGNTVLELGCGTGKIALPLAEAGFDMTGIDFSESQ